MFRNDEINLIQKRVKGNISLHLEVELLHLLIVRDNKRRRKICLKHLYATGTTGNWNGEKQKSKNYKP